MTAGLRERSPEQIEAGHPRHVSPPII